MLKWFSSCWFAFELEIGHSSKLDLVALGFPKTFLNYGYDITSLSL